MSRKIKWSYGLTTVPERRPLAGDTIKSLREAGFYHPMVFNDVENVGIVGTWILAAWRIYLANPEADRFAIFQDDIQARPGLRDFIGSWYPDHGYLNLYTMEENEPKQLEIPDMTGWYLSNQLGRGAQGLVFNNKAFRSLLASQDLVNRPIDAKVRNRKKNIDGAISRSMHNAGLPEFVHYPSLLQHVGTESTIKTHKYHSAPSFEVPLP